MSKNLYVLINFKHSHFYFYKPELPENCVKVMFNHRHTEIQVLLLIYVILSINNISCALLCHLAKIIFNNHASGNTIC
jgi:hypothetical protein